MNKHLILTKQQELKLEYNQVMDTLISQISWRFEALSNIANDFEFLSGFYINTLSFEDLKKYAADLVFKYSRDLNSKLLNEVECSKYQGEVIIPNLKMATYLDILNVTKIYELSSEYSE